MTTRIRLFFVSLPVFAILFGLLYWSLLVNGPGALGLVSSLIPKGDSSRALADAGGTKTGVYSGKGITTSLPETVEELLGDGWEERLAESLHEVDSDSPPASDSPFDQPGEAFYGQVRTVQANLTDDAGEIVLKIEIQCQNAENLNGESIYQRVAVYWRHIAGEKRARGYSLTSAPISGTCDDLFSGRNGDLDHLLDNLLDIAFRGKEDIIIAIVDALGAAFAVTFGG